MPSTEDIIARITPDTLFNVADRDTLTFVYKDGQLFHCYGICSHEDLYAKHGPRLFRSAMLAEDFVLGRAGIYTNYAAEKDGVWKTADQTPVVTFWNNAVDLREIKESLEKLLEQGLINYTYMTVIPRRRPQTLRDLLEGKKATNAIPVSPTLSSDILRKLHVLPAAEKKKMMAIKGDTTIRTPVSRPGSKWWAPYSEGVSFKEWLHKNIV